MKYNWIVISEVINQYRNYLTGDGHWSESQEDAFLFVRKKDANVYRYWDRNKGIKHVRIVKVVLIGSILSEVRG